jgi:hypothetical protein
MEVMGVTSMGITSIPMEVTSISRRFEVVGVTSIIISPANPRKHRRMWTTIGRKKVGSAMAPEVTGEAGGGAGSEANEALGE